MMIVKTMCIASLMLATNDNSNDCNNIDVSVPEQRCLGTDDKAEYVYTKEYDGPIENRRVDRVYCTISREHYNMLPGIAKADSDGTCEGDMIVVELEYLHNGDNPRKWIDYVMYYSTERRSSPMDDNMFFGVALYSQRYMTDSSQPRAKSANRETSNAHKEILLDNLFILYIEQIFFDNPGGFYSRIYMSDATNLRNGQELSLLEGVMRNTLLKLINMFGLRAVVEGSYLKICPPDDNEEDDEGPFVFREFKNVIIDDLPAECLSADDKIVLLTFAGMIRTGEHVVSLKCKDWAKAGDFRNVIKLVNTNENLVGVTDLAGEMGVDWILNGIKNQLKYLSIALKGENRTAIKRLINGLRDPIEIDATVDACDISEIKELLGLKKVGLIRNLTIVSKPDCSIDQDAMKFISVCPKILHFSFITAPEINEGPKI